MAHSDYAHASSVGPVEDGHWLTASIKAPYFCLEGERRQEVEHVAHQVLSWDPSKPANQHVRKEGLPNIVEAVGRGTPRR